MTTKPKRKKARSLSVDIKLRSGPVKASQIVYDEEGIIREQGKEFQPSRPTCFHPGQSRSASKKGNGKEGIKRVPVPAKKRFCGRFKHRQVKDFIVG